MTVWKTRDDVSGRKKDAAKEGKVRITAGKVFKD